MSCQCVLLILALVCGESLIHNMVPDLEDNTTYWLGGMDASYFLCKLECSSLDLSASKELGRAEAKAGSIGIRSLWWDLEIGVHIHWVQVFFSFYCATFLYYLVKFSFYSPCSCFSFSLLNYARAEKGSFNPSLNWSFK